MMRFFQRLGKIECLAIATLVAIGGLIGWASSGDSPTDKPGYEVIISDDLEPFRSDFNAKGDHVRAVILVGPT